MVELVPATDHLLPVEARTRRTTDRVALNLFDQLRTMSTMDCRFVLAALDGRLAHASGERVVTARAAIEQFTRETGEHPSKKRYERWRVEHIDVRTLPSATYIANTWQGSWSQAMHELGLQPAPDHAARRMAKTGSRRTDEELLEHVRECAAELGHPPTYGEHTAWQREKLANGVGYVRYLGKQTYRSRFGSWPNVLIAAGLASDGKIAARTRRVDWASGQPLQHMRDATNELGAQRLRYEQYDAWRKRRIAQQLARNDMTAVATGHAICQHYGGWRLALVAAGLMSSAAAENMRGGAGRGFTDADIEQTITRFAAESTEPPNRSAYTRWRDAVMDRERDTHLPSFITLGQLAGGWMSMRARVDAHREADGRQP
jgi:hypothetical protein